MDERENKPFKEYILKAKNGYYLKSHNNMVNERRGVMPTINENEKYKERKEDFYSFFGEDTYKQIIKETNWNENDNVILAYFNMIKGKVKDKDGILEFSKFFSERYGSNYKGKNPNSGLFNTILSREFVPYYEQHFSNAKEVEVLEDGTDTANDLVKNDSNTDQKNINENNAPVVDLSSIEAKLDKNNEMLEDAYGTIQIIGKGEIEQSIFNGVETIKKTLNKQIGTKTEKKATFAQIEGLERRLQGLDMKLDSVLDAQESIQENLKKQMKDNPNSPSDRRNNLLLGLGIGVAIGLVFIILLSVLR